MQSDNDATERKAAKAAIADITGTTVAEDDLDDAEADTEDGQDAVPNPRTTKTR